MDADKIERYEISRVPDGLHIVMWQVLPRVGGGVIALVLLVALFLTDPYAGHNRIWAGLGVGTLALVALFGMRIENWTIADSEFRYRSSVWKKEICLERIAGTPLTIRVELLPRDREGDLPPFPHVARLVGPAGIEVGDGFYFRERVSLDRFVEKIRTAGAFDIDTWALDEC